MRDIVDVDDPFAAPGEVGGGAGGGGALTLEREQELVSDEQIDDGDHDRFAHYVLKNKIVDSAVTGEPIRALCGKVWVPGRDPEKFPVCPDCKKRYDEIAARSGQ